MKNTVSEIKNWFQKAVPAPSDKNRAVQLGCHFEEVGEMLLAMGLDGIDYSELAALASELKDCGKDAESLQFLTDGVFPGVDKTELLDALCDQIVTAVGVAHMFGMNIEGALTEINRSNWSKFVNEAPVFDENGKIAKGPDYTPPDLTEFLGTWVSAPTGEHATRVYGTTIPIDPSEMAPQQPAPAPMSPANRLVAYSAATRLRELGFEWDATAEAWLQPAPSAQADAPVVLPEPVAYYDGERWYANEESAICACADMPKLQKVYTEQQVRAMLAAAPKPPAHEPGQHGSAYPAHGITAAPNGGDHGR